MLEREQARPREREARVRMRRQYLTLGERRGRHVGDHEHERKRHAAEGSGSPARRPAPAYSDPVQSLSLDVRLRLLPTEAGGRSRPIGSDFRADWDLKRTWNGEPTLNGAPVWLPEDRVLAPGEEGAATLKPIAEEHWAHLKIGDVLPMHEGPRVVGTAIVTAIARPPYLTPEVVAFVLQVDTFCDFVERASTLSMLERLVTARTRLLELYRVGLALPSVEPETGDAPPERSARPERWVGFAEHDTYAEIFDPYVDDPPVVGSLSDDLLDVYGDMVRGLDLWKHGQRTNAVWEWRFGFARSGSRARGTCRGRANGGSHLASSPCAARACAVTKRRASFASRASGMRPARAASAHRIEASDTPALARVVARRSVGSSRTRRAACRSSPSRCAARACSAGEQESRARAMASS